MRPVNCHSSLNSAVKMVKIYCIHIFSQGFHISYLCGSQPVSQHRHTGVNHAVPVSSFVLQSVVWHALEMLLHEWSWSRWCFTIAEWFSCFHCTSSQVDIYVNYWNSHNYMGCLTKHTLSWTHHSLISQQWHKSSDSLCGQLQYIEMEHSPLPRNPVLNICNVVVIIWG
jgi:hypothetical protein